MKVRGDLPPSGAFTLEEQPNRPGFVLVRFYENARPFEETLDGLTSKGYEYDEYHLELENYGGLSDDIMGNYEGYLAQAKLAEAEGETIPNLLQQVETLENQLTDTQMALCDVYEIAMGGSSQTAWRERS